MWHMRHAHAGVHSPAQAPPRADLQTDDRAPCGPWSLEQASM